MTPGLLKLLAAIAIGPSISLLVIGAAATATVTLCLFHKLAELKAFLMVAKLEMQATPIYCLLCGAASILLAAFVVFAFLLHHKGLHLLGLLLMFVTAAYITGGSLISAGLIGSRIRRELSHDSTRLANLAIGYFALFCATLLPVVGWIAAVLPIVMGTGALLKCTFTKVSR